MLTRLHISNIVLIDKLNLEFGAGLNVLTGETGAGKSILLDALALALGARSDAGLLRAGENMATVIAEFNSGHLPPDIISEFDIDINDELILRRTLSADGKSKAWINDVPVTIKTLKAVGDALVEIHGQFENHTLLDPATHIVALDNFAGGKNPKYSELLGTVRGAHNQFRGAEKKLSELRDILSKSIEEREFLEYNIAELSALKPIAGEETELADARARMMDAEKNTAILSDAKSTISGAGKSPAELAFATAHILERIKTDPNPYQKQIDELYNIGETLNDIAEKIAPADMDTDSLENTEERLFALRAAARKHRVAVDDLAAHLMTMSEQLNAIDNSDAELQKAEAELKFARALFEKSANELHKLRTAAADELRTKILAELPALKLEKADLKVDIVMGPPAATGIDTVTFTIRTNPGSRFAPLHKTASGGELARFMLALRVVLINNAGTEKVFIFDEVDTGISGATASAVGDRLSRLAAGNQAIVITHSAQVAGCADHHYLISKSSDDDSTTTHVNEITGEERVHEIARIISGAEITAAGAETAKQLLKK